MKKVIIKALMTMIFIGIMSIPLFAEEFTPEEAKELTIKACDLIESVGIEQAREQLHDINGPYRKGEKGELYVSVINWKGEWLAYPPRPAGVGKSVLNAKDPDGRYLVKEMIKIAKTKGTGWSEYRWLNPKTGKIQKKSAYVKRVNGQTMYVSAGVYK